MKRPPTIDEIEKRIQAVGLLVGCSVGVGAASGGTWLFFIFVQDSVWRDMFTTIWWAPCLIAGMLASNGLCDWLLGWVEETE
jgi:hypothetical protein